MGARSRVFWGTALAVVGIVTVPTIAHDREPPIISIPTDGANPSSRAGLLSLMETLRAIREQLRSLENQVEIENHKISRLRQQQQAFFADFDRQLRHARGAGTAAGVAPQSPPDAAGNTAGSSGSGVTVIPPDTSGPTVVTPSAPSGPPASTSGTGTGAGSTSSAERGGAQKMYDKAFNLLRAGRYRHAVSAFQAFLQAHPHDKRAARAQYWVAETDYVERDYPSAEQAFKALVDGYPQSKRVPNALLKMGYIAKWQGHPNKARTTWQGLIARYPGTMAAQVARNSLTNLGAPGKAH